MKTISKLIGVALLLLIAGTPSWAGGITYYAWLAGECVDFHNDSYVLSVDTSLCDREPIQFLVTLRQRYSYNADETYNFLHPVVETKGPFQINVDDYREFFLEQWWRTYLDECEMGEYVVEIKMKSATACVQISLYASNPQYEGAIYFSPIYFKSVPK